jgi:hypothetical protein
MSGWVRGGRFPDESPADAVGWLAAVGVGVGKAREDDLLGRLGDDLRGGIDLYARSIDPSIPVY